MCEQKYLMDYKYSYFAHESLVSANYMYLVSGVHLSVQAT